jgi:FtsP/CotA-like multicopper oxidase with cupredoxin domain
MSQTPVKDSLRNLIDTQEAPEEERPKSKIYIIALLVVAVFVIASGVVMTTLGSSSTSPTGSTATSAFLPAPPLPSGPGVPASVNMGMPGAAHSITSLKAPLTAAHMKEFTLVAQNAMVSLGSGIRIPAWTFNGMAPGPLLQVQQGDLVVVHVVNHFSFGITIHWHGIDSFNSSDGVAGLTQDAIKPGQTYTYRFFTPDAGTYWYHAHQLAYDETMGGLFGSLIVEPKTQTIHADVDTSVALHEWNGPNNQSIFTLNDATQTLNEAARPGQWVRLRIVETSNTDTSAPHLVTLIGAPFKVVSLDGHDLNDPQWLNHTPLPIGTAQRYDLLFQMPAHSSVSLVSSSDGDTLHYQRSPALLFGQGAVPTTLPPVTKWFDLTTYGTATATAITPNSHFDASYTIALNNQMGTSLGRMGMTYTMNGKVFPYTGMIMVKEGQLIRIHLVNQSDLYHPIHLHGHIFTVLTRNGKPLTGSPIRLDTILVLPHSTYDIAFVANNPGIWMLHCHNFLHANWGMDMMVAYEGYSTPYTMGTASGNFPD